jgi:hypothetical protein
LTQIGHPELINNNDDRISFIYNGMILRFGDTRNIQELGLSDGGKIIVFDIDNLKGG